MVVREIDDRGKVSLDLAEGVELEIREGAKTSSGGGDRGRGDRGGRDRDRGGRDRGGRDRDRGGRNRDRGRDRDRDRGRQPESKPGRTVVSFEDEFESGV